MGQLADRWFGRSSSPAQEERSLHSIGDPATAFILGGYATPGVPAVSEQRAMTLSAVYRATSIVAGSIAGLPMRTMQGIGDGRSEISASFLDTPGAASAAGGVRLTPFEWKELVSIHLLLQGNAFLQHIRNGAGQLVALNPIHPLNVGVEWEPSAYGGKLFKVQQDTGKPLELDANNITQIMGQSFDGLRGMSVVTLARLSLAISMAGDKATHKQFKNGAMISALITPESEMKISKDEAEKMQAELSAAIGGVENAGGLAFVSKSLRVNPWMLSPTDAQFLESRTFQIDEVGRWFGVPPHLLGLAEKSTSWGQGIAEQNRGLSRYTLSPWTNRIQERLATLLPPNKWVEFDYKTFVKPSPEDEIRLIIEQLNSGLLTPNEARELLNRGPLPGGNVARLPAGSLPADQMQPQSQDNGAPREEV